MNAFAKCLLLCLCLMILSCGHLSTKRSVAPKPPQIVCSERRPADPVPSAPVSTDWREWAAAFAAAMGWGTQQTEYRADTADCLDRYRAAGDIR